MATKKTLVDKKSRVAELHLAIAPDASFKEIVAILEKTLTIPELPGLRGCLPCRSGIDRIVIEDPVLRGMR